MIFFVPGRPKGTQTGSVIRVGGRSFPIRRGTPWSSYCALVAQQHAPARPIEGPILDVRMIFFLPRPKKPKYPYPATRPDLDNLVKGLLDKFNGILWHDDAQIIELSIGKRYTDALHPEGVRVEVQEGIR